jgi:hypothetical protein
MIGAVTPDTDTIKGMLQALEDAIDNADRVNAAAIALLSAHKSGTLMAPVTQAHYDWILAELEREREQLRTIIARWGTMLEDTQH